MPPGKTSGIPPEDRSGFPTGGPIENSLGVPQEFLMKFFENLYGSFYSD